MWKEAVYQNWENCFCEEHLDRSTDHVDEINATQLEKKVNHKKALTKEEAKALKGTGYQGEKPNSNAETMALKAAMAKCKKCGMHTRNGRNSLCYACEFNKEHGFD